MDKQLHKTHRESGVVRETKCAVKLPSKIRDGPWHYSLKDKQNKTVLTNQMMTRGPLLRKLHEVDQKQGGSLI